MTTSIGYASSSHFGVHFGVPKGQGADTLEIWWPGGGKQVVKGGEAAPGAGGAGGAVGAGGSPAVAQTGGKPPEIQH